MLHIVCMQHNDRCTIVVSSCDEYFDALDPFFILFNKYFPNCPFDVCVLLEKKEYYSSDNKYKIFNSNEKSWSKRLLDALLKIQSEYIFLLLEDYFVVRPVNLKVLLDIIDIMNNNKKICAVTLNHYAPENDKKHIKTKYDIIEKRGHFSDYKTQCGLNIWRREKLIKYLGVNESPWEFEAFANFRTWLFPQDEFYTICNNIRPPYDINFEKRIWSPICKGKWVLEECDSLFKDNDIFVNYNNMGIANIDDILKSSGDVKENIIIKKLRYSKWRPILSFILHLKYLNKFHN